MSRVPLAELLLKGSDQLSSAAGETVFVYERGTEEAAILYTSETGEATVSQPLKTDAAGLPTHEGAQVWIEPGSYTLNIGGQTTPWEASASKLAVEQRTPLVYPDELGAVGNNSTDNTAVFESMIEAAGPGTVFQFGPGKYKTGSLGSVLAEKRNITFRGIGNTVDTSGGSVSGTTLVFTGTGVFVGLGTFTATPANYWQGLSQGFSAEKLMFYSEVGNGQTAGSRTPIAIQDNGCGNVTLRDCQFLNFKWAFASPYGSDFSCFDRLKFSLCDGGIYLGPGSGEVYVGVVEYDRCQEGFVADSCQQGHMVACAWEDNAILDVKFEYLETTRFGLTGERNALNDLSWVLETNKHESNAGGTGVVWSTAPIQLYTDKADKSYPRGLLIRNPRWIAGGAESTTRAFCEVTTGDFITIENPRGTGVAGHYWINRGEAHNLVLKNPRTIDGTAEILPFRNENAECHLVNEFANSIRGTGAKAKIEWVSSTGNKYRWDFAESLLKPEYWFAEGEGGQWLERLFLDAQNAAIKMREVEVKRAAANVLGLVASAGVRMPKLAAAAVAVECDYIDSTTGKRMYKNAAGEAKELG